MKAAAATQPKPKKPRAPKKKADDLALHVRYGHFGDAQADDSAAEERHVRAKLAPAKTDFERDYEDLFGVPYVAPDLAPEPPPQLPPFDFGPALMHMVDTTFFAAESISTGHLKSGTMRFVKARKALDDKLFAHVAVLLSRVPELARFHEALRKDNSLTWEPVTTDARKWGVPADAGYRVLRVAEAAPVAVSRDMAQLLGVCHAVYHLADYLRLAIFNAITPELQAQVMQQPLSAVWSALCGGEPWATQQSVTQWKWMGAAPFVQAIVQLRCVVETARGWVE